MSISSVGSSPSTPDPAYDVAVMRKQLDAQQLEGKNALSLIQGAAPAPLKPGHTLSVVG